MVKLDITNFFESISERQVYHCFRRLGYRALVAFYLARLCTRELPFDCQKSTRWTNENDRKFLSRRQVGHLPQGAPTSPMLANLACSSLDSEIAKAVRRRRLTYTRYADDITLSGRFRNWNDAAKLSRRIQRIVSDRGFSINSQKTHIATNGARKIVTGLSVEGNKTRLLRSYKDEIRKELYFMGKFGLIGHCRRIRQKNPFSYLLRIVGKIEYVTLVEPQLGIRLKDRFIELFPEFLRLRALVFNQSIGSKL